MKIIVTLVNLVSSGVIVKLAKPIKRNREACPQGLITVDRNYRKFRKKS
jgi:hypothetical protein